MSSHTIDTFTALPMGERLTYRDAIVRALIDTDDYDSETASTRADAIIAEPLNWPYNFSRVADSLAVSETPQRSAMADALAVMRRREADAVRDLIEMRQRVYSLETNLAAAQAAATMPAIPWGPLHPDWDRFWLQAAADATVAGNCSEFDRHAVEMGGPSRWDLERQGHDLHSRTEGGETEHTVRVYWTATISGSSVVTLTTETPNLDLDDYDLLEEMGGEPDYSDGEMSDIEVTDHYVMDSVVQGEGTPRYWVNPTRGE